MRNADDLDAIIAAFIGARTLDENIAHFFPAAGVVPQSLHCPADGREMPLDATPRCAGVSFRIHPAGRSQP